MSKAGDYRDLPEAELLRLEREIAREHIGKFPWLAVVWAIANFAVWLSLWPLVILGVLPLWAGLLIAAVNVSISYLPSHEAQHDIIARPGEKLRWLNELVGTIGAIPLVIPFGILRATHMEHHKNANHPELDPDYHTHAPGPLQAIWRHFEARQPGLNGVEKSYRATLERLGRQDLLTESAFYSLGYYGFLIAMAWAGFAIEAALLWWLPRHVAFSYILFFLSWAPHHPGKETGRYRDTRAFRFALGNVLSMGMQFHIVHHLHPRIPLYRTPKAYWQMRPILEARKCDLKGL